MNELEAIDRLLFQCDLPMALPDEVKKEIIRSKKEVLVSILKKAGKYSISLAIIINIALLLKKIGIGVSAAKIGVAVHTVAILAATTTVVGTGTVIYRAVASKSAVEPVITAPVIPDAKIETPPVSGTSAAKKVRQLCIVPFTGNQEISEEIAGVCDGIFRAIGGTTSPETIIQSSGDDVDARLILSGSVSLINGIYYVRVKLIESESSRIVSAVIKTAASKEELEAVSESIADEIRPQLK